MKRNFYCIAQVSTSSVIRRDRQCLSLLKTLLNLIFSYILPQFFLYPLLSSRQNYSCPTALKSVLVISRTMHQGFGGLRPSRFILVPPEGGKLRSLIFIIYCSLLEKSKSTGLNALLRASKDLKSQRPTKKHLEASVRHLGYSRLSGLKPGFR